MDVIQEKLKLLPESPGVYIMLGSDSEVIYVGKARVLKNRVRQYFHGGAKTEKVAQMVSNIADFNYIITETEIDALALENSLIKKYKPKYNILLKDDKTYPYIKADVKSDFPSFFVTRKVVRDGSRYFGPFMGGINCRDLLETIQITFGVRLCHTKITEKPQRECLNYHIGRCGAPCAHKITKEDYAKRVEGAVSFLDGNLKPAQTVLKEKMTAAADAENFEQALDYRNKLEMLDKLEQKRVTALERNIDADVVAYATNGLYSAVNVLITRGGIMQGGFSYALEDAHLTDSEAVTNFMTSYYQTHMPPQEIICAECEAELLTQYFKEQYKKSVDITEARQGVKFRLLQMAQKNAEDFLEKSVDKIKHRDDMTVNACERLKEILHLKRYPKRMECYDISNVSGVDKVGAMVVFSDGEPDKQSYRRFKIKTVEGADDFASLKEMLTRRLSKLGTDEEERFPRPDLVIIDGGKGQLSAVKEVFDGFKLDIDLISLAKKEEEIFTVDSDESVRLSHRDFSLQMLQRIRDEAHRFAVTYFRNLHSKRNLSSVLEEIDGVGKQKRETLMEKFGSLDKIMSAKKEEIAAVPGIGEKLAEKIKTYLEENL